MGTRGDAARLTTPTTIELIFGHDTEPPPCPACSGIGLRCIEPDEVPDLCPDCGGSGMGSVLAPAPATDPRQLRLELGDELAPDDGDDDDFLIVDPNFLARYRKPMTEAELDQEAAAFGAAIMQALQELEDQAPD